ncbi:MarR family winged helix-turn-helix transcriptional regulator [Cystobacter fuscus]
MRHLIELLDGDVAQAYVDAGLDYRPRYTPVMRVLAAEESASVGRIAQVAGITQPAATQTIALMKKQGLVTVSAGADGRERVVRLSVEGKRMLPKLQACWAASKAAADSLDAALPYPLSQCLADAIEALRAESFGTRIRNAHTSTNKKRKAT